MTFLNIFPAILLLLLLIFLFFREVKLDYKRYREADRLGDEHIMREIEKFLLEKEQSKIHETSNV